MLELYQLTGDPRYYDAFAQTLDFIEQHQVAPDGGWWATRNEDGSAPRTAVRSSMWQGAYHAGRALLLSSKRLANLKPPTN
jgi:mannose/cellobiose epimerase-like protein (N-acyl-D-glucosamine 2-epimerase family)